MKISKPFRESSRTKESRTRNIGGSVYRFEHAHHSKEGVAISCMIEVWKQWGHADRKTGWHRVRRFTYYRNGGTS